MGSSCVCPSNQPSITPRPQRKENSFRQIKPQADIKFADIVPVEVLDIEDSEYDLNVLTNHIVGCLDEYEKDNGVISRRLRLQQSCFQSDSIGKISFSSQIQPQRYKTQKRVNQKEAMYIELESRERQFAFNQQQMPASVESEGQEQKQQSCMLSQQSHILQSSIFTDRLKVKQQFYGKYNTFAGNLLLPWQDSVRLSYQIDDQQLKIQVSKKSQLKLTVLFEAIKKYNENNSIHLLSYSLHPLGLKLYFNGKKRLLPIEGTEKPRLSLASLIERLSVLNTNYQISQIAYITTGWIPEELRMSQIRSFQGIFQRLSGNIEEGNTLVFFSRRQKKSIYYAALSKIDLENGLISINSCGNKSLIPDDFLVQPRNKNGDQIVRMQDFVMLVDVIHLNWNPTIYDYSITRESLLTNTSTSTRYKLVIPPSSQDIQIRLFVQVHHQTNTGYQNCNLIVKLFQFESMGNVDGAEPIRVVEVDKKIFSDVFIFQSCKQKSEYVLIVETSSGNLNSENIYSTLTLYSFVDMHFNQIHANPLLTQISIDSKITASNMGYGINSPYFTKNLQYFIETDANRQLTVSVFVSQDLSYQICLIPNPDNRQVLTQLNLESIISNSLLSHQKHGTGSFTINTTCSHYILVINSFTQFDGEIQIVLSLHGKQNLNSNPVLYAKSITNKNNIVFFQQIKWLPTHFGPRKRLKSNSNNHFQPAQVFSDFFKNPCIEKELKKGKYQFFIRSQTFQEYFDSVETPDKNQCEPPALSLSVLEVSSGKKQYKIVIDDAYYVPFGIGFWTQVVDLEDAVYKFVLPTMEKNFAVGIFGIIQY